MDSTDNEVLWERHAAWWQREFSTGADPEYEDQILPLVGRQLGGARRVLDIGCGEGQVARHLAGLGVEVIGLDPTSSQVATARDRAGGPRYARARADALPCRDARLRRACCCVSRSSTSTSFEAAIARSPACSSPAGASCWCCAIRCCRRRGSGWVDDQISGEHYWRIRAVPARRHGRRRGRARGRPAVHPSSASAATSTRWGSRAADRRHGGTPAAAAARGRAVGLPRSGHDPASARHPGNTAVKRARSPCRAGQLEPAPNHAVRVESFVWDDVRARVAVF